MSLYLRRKTEPMTGVVHDLLVEYQRAKAKHQEHSLDNPEVPDHEKLGDLIEEVGEVGKCFCYDQLVDGEVDLVHLREELIQTANVALTWASILPHG